MQIGTGIGLSDIAVLRLGPPSAPPDSDVLSAGTGTFEMTGSAASLRKSRRLLAEGPVFSVTGSATALRRGRVLAAGAGSFAVTGGAATLGKGNSLAAETGSFALTGDAAVLRATRSLVSESGSFVLTGGEATLTYVSASPYVFDYSTAALPDGATYTRTGERGYINSTPEMAFAAANAPRFDHDPVTGAYRGILFEPAKTELHDNPTLAGSPPPGMQIPSPSNGLTATVTGNQTVDGVPGFTVRYVGTTTGTSTTITLHDGASVPATAATVGTTFIGGCYVKLVAGATTNISSFNFRMAERKADGGYATSSGNTSVNFTPTTASAASQRVTATRELQAADAVRPQALVRLNYSSGVAIDVTLFIGLCSVVDAATATGLGSPVQATGGYGADQLVHTVPNGDYEITVTMEGGSYSVLDTVSTGSHNFYLPSDAIVAGETRFTGISYAQQAAGSTDLTAPWDFDAVLAQGVLVDGDEGTNLRGTPPVYTTNPVTLADKDLWDTRAYDIFDDADDYMLQGSGATVLADNIRRYILNLAENDYMRLNASTNLSGGDGQTKNFVSERNWAVILVAWSYMKCRGIFSAGEQAAIEAWFGALGDDIAWYYKFETDTLGSKLNNHFGWGNQALMMSAVISNRRDLFERALASQRRIMYGTVADFVKDTSGPVPMLGYNPNSGTHPLPPGILSVDLDRYSSPTVHNGIYYNWWHNSSRCITGLFARANGVNLLTESTYDGDTAGATFDDILTGYKEVCDDAGAEVIAFLNAYDANVIAAGDTVTTSDLNVAAHKVKPDMSGFRLLTAIEPFASGSYAATIDANLTGKTDRLMGGSIDYLRARLV